VGARKTETERDEIVLEVIFSRCTTGIVIIRAVNTSEQRNGWRGRLLFLLLIC
jgi:hypothetical protein